MAYINTKRSALFLKDGATLPTPPANFIELSEEFVVNPEPTVEEFNRVSALLGGTDSYADTCHVVLNQDISTMMRTNDKQVQPWEQSLKLGNYSKYVHLLKQQQQTMLFMSIHNHLQEDQPF